MGNKAFIKSLRLFEGDSMKKIILILVFLFLLLTAVLLLNQPRKRIVVGTLQGGISTLDLMPDVDVRYFDKTLDLAQALMRGDVDFAVIPAELVAKIRMMDSDVKIISVDMMQNQAIVVKDISSLEGLRGKRIGVFTPTGTFAMFSSYMSALNITDFKLVDKPPAQLIQAFQKDEVDAVVIWEPYVSKLVGMGGKILVTFRDLWRICGLKGDPVMVVWAARPGIDADSVNKVMKMREKALSEWGNETLVVRVMMDKYGLTAEEASFMYKRVEIVKTGLDEDLKRSIREVWYLAWRGGYIQRDPSEIGEDAFWSP
ncbi:MAG: hypothetical protein DSO07_09535 [Thermoproteota archaeon]|jgi:NitT/TauT family transport system substrate-binding protein|uniref:ABC transporter substrate-binding protein n=2 Tax=Candidatus Methanodesulfokora washburnensis TaxID=2478471 RepID=A0A429GVF1_9CREN|nr:ABC transporter substrate-binding protein [Candidatus Methanodesulfokores washburnensis]RZN62783.1 MAG: ABC transporter substrate-binding protein [Candidatus Methanodesulfokores washburnensis]TDA40321.1 MAG: hypothetical protein DSO07_09535 [Candidatus Korarchaeota archaeon]